MVELENKSAILSVDLAGVEGRTVVTEAPAVRLIPAIGIERVKVVLPVEVKATSLRVVVLNLDVVVAREEWHALVAEVITPACEGGRPEIHKQVLRLVGPVDVCATIFPAAFVAIDGPADVLGGPLDDIFVPVGAWLEAITVLLILLLPLPDDVGAEWVRIDGRHELNVDLVPALL